MSILTEKDEARFWSKVNRTSEEGCWLWTGRLTKGRDYGRFRVRKHQYAAHSISFSLSNSDYTLSETKGRVLHTCSSAHCVNPSHLVLQPSGEYLEPTELDKARFNSKISTVPTEKGCLLWQAATSKLGYGAFSFGGKDYAAHRLALILHDPIAFANRGDKTHACHKCDVPGCCNSKHLFWGSASDNQQDMASKGRAGDSGSKLKDADVLDIKTRIARGDKVCNISKDYPVNRQAISKIKRGVTWKHILLPGEVTW